MRWLRNDRPTPAGIYYECIVRFFFVASNTVVTATSHTPMFPWNYGECYGGFSENTKPQKYAARQRCTFQSSMVRSHECEQLLVAAMIRLRSLTYSLVSHVADMNRVLVS